MFDYDTSRVFGDVATAEPPIALDRTVTGGHARRGSARSHPAHERAAHASAIDDGLMPDEVERILGGRRLVEAFPVRWNEGPEAYAARAVSEMFVAYLR